MDPEIFDDLKLLTDVQTAPSLFKHRHLHVTNQPETSEMGCTCLSQDNPACFSQTVLIVVSISSSVAAFLLGCIVTYVLIRKIRIFQRRTVNIDLDEGDTSDSGSNSVGEFQRNNPEFYESGRYVSINDSREHTYESMRKIVYKPNHNHGDDECMDYLPLRSAELNRVSELRDDIETIDDSDVPRFGDGKENEAANHDYFILEPLERAEPATVIGTEDSSNDATENHIDFYVDTEIHDNDYHVIESQERTDKENDFENTYESYGEYEKPQTRCDFDGHETGGFMENENTSFDYRIDGKDQNEEDYTNILLESSGHLYSGLMGTEVSAVIHSSDREADDNEDGIYEDENVNEKYQDSDIYTNYDSDTYIVNYSAEGTSDTGVDITTNRKIRSISSDSQDDSVFVNDNCPDTNGTFDNFHGRNKNHHSEGSEDSERGVSKTRVFTDSEERQEMIVFTNKDKDQTHDFVERGKFHEQDQIHVCVGGEPVAHDDIKEDCATRKESHVYINVRDIEREVECVNRDVT